MNSEICREIKIRDRLHNTFTKNRTQVNLNKSKHQRNKVNYMKKYARQSFYENIDTTIDQLYSDPKIYWKRINRITKQSGTSTVIPPLLDNARKTIVSGNQEKANLLN